ncbi:type II restriction endonuclease [Arcticibacter tournemirensis]|uniref:Restriction endonuclease n=2 Tax=Pseudomonadati TaxID=3379134 RepID=A0A4Q0MB70_9SPHI|nr:type II restriction endonuclease [Arcticibacter tournemirensis]RXF70527.1 restriction endonuclease [Arcticibacter tournemirensis]
MSKPFSSFFLGIGAKRLSQVDIDSSISNQHEIGSNSFTQILGSEKVRFSGKFIYMPDNEDGVIENQGQLTWYDTRENQPHRSAEWRLYYTSQDVIPSAKVNDLVIIARTAADQLLLIVSPMGSTSEHQLLWLFGLEEVGKKFIIRDFSGERRELGFAAKYIVSSLGIETEETADDYLEELLRRYGKTFPTTKVFSEFSRSTVKHVSPVEAPDETLLAWMEREELLFKTLERVIVEERLQKGFGTENNNVEEFINFSLSVHNRRKSRAGFSLEHNLCVLFSANEIRYSHGAVTERNSKPDFIFPGITHYKNSEFDVSLLTMLGVKTTAKDRWRQVLAEASRIQKKHLITLEPGISSNQTEEMKANYLQLVIPAQILPSFSYEQRSGILTLKDFIDVVKDRQERVPL